MWHANSTPGESSEPNVENQAPVKYSNSVYGAYFSRSGHFPSNIKLVLCAKNVCAFVGDTKKNIIENRRNC